MRAALPASDYKGDLGAYRRAVLNVEVERLLAESGAQKLGIAIDENAIDARYKFFEDQSGGSSSFASQLASRLAVSPSLYRQLVRTEVIESEIGYTAGGVKRPTDAQLQALYQQYLPTAISATLSLIQVPDQATANQTAAALTKAPDTFATVAAQYTGSGSQTAPNPQKYVLSRLPAGPRGQAGEDREGHDLPVRAGQRGGQGLLRDPVRAASTGRRWRAPARSWRRRRCSRRRPRARSTCSRWPGDTGVDVNPRYGTWKADQLAITDFVNPVIKPTPSPPAAVQQRAAGRRHHRWRHHRRRHRRTGTQPVPTPTG